MVSAGATARRNGVPWLIACVLLGLLLTLWAFPVTAQKSQKQISQFKELLTSYQGHQTSLGTLKKVSGDYVTFEQEQGTSMYPIGVIQCIRLAKDEETGATAIEIRVLAKE